MKKALILLCSLFLIVAGVASATAVEVPSLQLGYGGDSYWHKYNIVYGYTTMGSLGRAYVRNVLTVVDGGYTIISDKVEVNVTYADVILGPTLLYAEGSTIHNKGASYTEHYGTSVSKTKTVDDYQEYQNNNMITYYGAQQINSVSYTSYGTWYSKNYNSHHM